VEPFVALVVVTAVARGVAARTGRGRREALALALRWGVGVMFTMTGVSHFVGMRADLVAMVPGWAPAPGLLVTLTGVLELAGAAGMLVRPLVPWAGLGLSALLVVMFPANVHLALAGDDLAWWDELVPRTLVQGVFLAATVTLTVLGFAGRRTGPAAHAARPTTADPARLAR
jgi:uncharacterized membrane protein